MNERRLLSIQIEEAKNDRARLAQLDQQLIGRSEFGALRYVIAGHVNRLRKAEEARAPLAAAVARFGISKPDDRWLFQYAISDESYAKLQSQVCSSAAMGRLFSGWNPAYFVLWAAEWFRRNHPGGMRRWADLEGVLGAKLDHSHWRELTKLGLACWGRNVIQSDSVRYFLSTLAREGGFPSAALSSENQGWARSVLASMVAALLAEDPVSEARALEIARSQQGRIPEIFSDDDFLQLCADLALQIARLLRRANAKAESAGIPVAAWLDANESGWREALPIPRDSKRSKLLDELMTVKAHRLPKGYLEATRYLVRSEDVWMEALQLELDGELTDVLDRRISRGSGRLWAYASGELNRYLAGELAYLDPVVDEKVWLRSSGRSDTLHKVPFSCPIELELRTSDKDELKLAIPGGAPVRGQILVFTIEREKDGEPIELLLRGTGSGKYQHEQIVAAVPKDWVIQTTSDCENVEDFGIAPNGAVLWRISGGALIVTSTGDSYRVLCGQAADGVDAMSIEAATLPSFVTPDNSQTEVFIGPIKVRLTEGFKQVATTNRLFVRGVGESKWSRFEGSPGYGYLDLAWREGNIVRASRRVLLFPERSSIQISGTGSQTRYTWNGGHNWTLDVAADAPVRPVPGQRALVARRHGGLQRRFHARVDWRDGVTSNAPGIFLDFPCGAGISDWEGRIVSPGMRLTLTELRSLQAYADGRMSVFGDLIDDNGRVVTGTELIWSFDKEMPLAVMEPELRSLLSPYGPSACVKLGMLDGIEAYWIIHQFEPPVQLLDRGLQSQIAIAEDAAELCVRSISRYSREIRLCQYSLVHDQNHQPVSLPNALPSPFLAYVRAGHSILTEPVWIENGSLPGRPCDELARVMLADPESSSSQDFLETLAAENPPARSSLEAVVRLISSLNGLPPKVFSVLEALPQHPLALIRLLGVAPPDMRQTILALDKGLPFAWYLLPRRLWQSAMREITADMDQRLLAEGVPDRDRYFGKMLADFRETLLRHQPCAHDMVFPCDSNDLKETVQSFLNANVDRLRPTAGSMFRDAGAPELPDFLKQLPDHCLETLDAPFAAAAAAAGAWAPNVRHIERIKTVNRRYPEYFRAAFAACLR